MATRYAGQTMIPHRLLEIKDHDKKEAAIAKLEEEMMNKPLTDEEERQKAEWENLIFGPGSFEPLDDNFVDAAIAWSEGRGPYPE